MPKQKMTVREFLKLISDTFPNQDLDMITDFKVAGRVFSVSHGKAISTTTIEAPDERPTVNQ